MKQKILFIDLNHVLMITCHLTGAHALFNLKDDDKYRTFCTDFIKKTPGTDIAMKELCKSHGVKIFKHNTVFIATTLHTNAKLFLSKLREIFDEMIVFSTIPRPYGNMLLLNNELIRVFDYCLFGEESIQDKNFLKDKEYAIIDYKLRIDYRKIKKLNIDDSYEDIVNNHVFECQPFDDECGEVDFCYDTILYTLDEMLLEEIKQNNKGTQTNAV